MVVALRSEEITDVLTEQNQVDAAALRVANTDLLSAINKVPRLYDESSGK